MNANRLKAYAQLLIVVVIWGIAPTVIKFALGELPPFLFLAYRFFVTTLVLLPFYLTSKNKFVSIKTWPLLLLVSFLGSTLNLGLLFYGTNLTTSLDSSLISATSPILVILGGILFLKERETKREKIGVAITMLGTILIAFQALFEHSVNLTHSLTGNSIIFLSNISFALYLILSKKVLKMGVAPFAMTFWTFLVGLITIIPLTLTEVKSTEILPKLMSVSLSAHLSVFYMALISGALAYYLYQKAQKTIEASEASVFNYLPPIVTAPIALFWLHEQMTTPYIVGSVIIALGVILAEWKKRRYNHS